MKIVAVLLRGLAACAFITPLVAGPITVDATAAFTGYNNAWNFQYVSGAPGVYLEQITINLGPADLGFDTAPGGFGSLGYQDVGGFNGTDVTTGLSNISATGAALDGGSLLTFTFADLTAGDTFTFSADVDHPNPTLQTLADCSSLKPIPKALCQASNAGKTLANDALLLNADTVTSAQMANATVTFEFGGPGFETSSVTDPLSAPTLQAILSDLAHGQGAASFASSNDVNAEVAPEPATFLAPVIGLAFLGFFSRRRLAARR
jgi:hypothetical protein